MIVADEALRIDVVLGLPPAAAAWPVTAKLDQRLDELSERRIELIAISAEAREGSEQLQADWKLERLPIAYGLTEPSDARVGPLRLAGPEWRTAVLLRATTHVVVPLHLSRSRGRRG